MRKFCVAVCFTAVCGTLSANTAYIQTNLSSDILGLAANPPDTNLKNPWGVSFGPTTPFWVSDQVTNVSTLYNGAGVAQSLVVSVPGGPTGQVFANIGGSFVGPNGTADLFIFATLSGNILGWNGGLGTTAAQEASGPAGAVFTGLAKGVSGGANFLYAADTANGVIDVFDSNFAPVAMPFNAPNVAGYTPYNIQNVNGKLYVEYAVRGSRSGGIVDVFDTAGNFLQPFATTTGLNDPWGVTQAPVTFGSFGGDILVGNFGDGTISAFDPVTGAFLGTISGISGPIVNGDLWALNFRAQNSGFDPNALFITAGINGQKDGLFAEIQVSPEPSTWAMLALGFGALGLVRRRARQADNQ